MKDGQKTKKQLQDELAALRQQNAILSQRVDEMETSETRQRQQQEEILDILRASTPVGLFMVQDGQFQFVNEDFRNVTGGSPDELMGTDPMALVLPEDRDMVRENAIAMLKGERTTPYKYRIMNRDGDIRWMLEGVASVQYRGKRAAVGHSMDITELERAQGKLEDAYEEERKLRRELEEEAQRRIEFTRALVHELKTPLTPVLSSSELLYSELREEPWMSIAENIHRGATNLSNRIDELLDLARVEIGILKVNRKAVDVLPLLRRVGKDMKIVALAAGQSLRVTLPDSLPRVWADTDRLRQVVQNLLINASKFTPDGGKITLRAKERDGSLVVEVQDNGPGIPEEDQKRLFQPYNRHLGDREYLSGLGLGLALCKYLVGLHDGEIWLNSRVGKGSIFGFSIPLATSIQQQVSTKEEAINESASY
ncbi:MAG TPA: PAS domain-containing sensor histidine kinase [Dehalococcoidales bacterium]|nr:PAS domain-containing sensor histidine kinase [Dehalococcoidales bacterium]